MEGDDECIDRGEERERDVKRKKRFGQERSLIQTPPPQAGVRPREWPFFCTLIRSLFQALSGLFLS
jgi:hypothetical protein